VCGHRYTYKHAVRSVAPGLSRCHAEAGMAGHRVSGQQQSQEQMVYWHSDSYAIG